MSTAPRAPVPGPLRLGTLSLPTLYGCNVGRRETGGGTRRAHGQPLEWTAANSSGASKPLAPARHCAPPPARLIRFLTTLELPP